MTRTPPDGFLAVPVSDRDSGALVLHAWWGLNDTLKAFCTRLAESGFVAFAPDLFHGQIADTIAEAEALGKARMPATPRPKPKSRRRRISSTSAPDGPHAPWP